MEDDPFVEVVVFLNGGFWLHPQLGVWPIEDKGSESAFQFLRTFTATIAQHQLQLGVQIRDRVAAGTAYRSFWHEVAKEMILKGDWLLVWRGNVFTKVPSVAAVKTLLTKAADQLPHLSWDGCDINIYDVPQAASPVTASWGVLLGR